MLGQRGLAPLDGAGRDAAGVELGGAALESPLVGLGGGTGGDGLAVLGLLVARVGGGEGGQAQDGCFGEVHRDLLTELAWDLDREKAQPLPIVRISIMES